MKRLYASLLLLMTGASFGGCVDSYLTTEPQTILTDELVWSDPKMVTGVISDIYSQLPQNLDFNNNINATIGYAAFDEALWSGIISTGANHPNQITNYPYNMWTLWNYGLIRQINLAIEKVEAASSPALDLVKAELLAELRFQRAYNYFELVKRMGGVPIITKDQIYDFSGDPSYLQQPRASEAEVYEFIANEVDAIVDKLGNAGSKTRANKYTALALKSRAMLYAGSLARHNSEMAVPITLPGGVVGIPASKAVEYYTKSLAASRAIITSGAYGLYQGNANKGENFYEAYTKKSGNNEVIWAKDYSVATGRTHQTTVDIIPRSMRIAINGSGLSPTLNLVETYDYLDGSPGTIPGVGTGSNTAAGQANWIFYDNISDPFERVRGGKDARLYGTVIYPGASARGQRIDIQAGVYVWNATANKYDRVEGAIGSTYTDGKTLTGGDGPRTGDSYVGNTGFYLRKYLDYAPAAATQTTGSDIWWVLFRMGEVYLNASEAAFELGLQAEAVGYMNTLRQRAGFPANSLTTLTRQKIRDERRIELAFEDHRIWDLIRWRIAEQVWDGSQTSLTANGYNLYPYRIVRPGHPNDGKFVFDKFKAPQQTNPRFFRPGNYYSQISDAVLGNNPKLLRNPFH